MRVCTHPGLATLDATSGQRRPTPKVSGSSWRLRSEYAWLPLRRRAECHHVIGDESLLIRVVLSGTDHLQGMLYKLARWGSPTTSIVLSSPVPRRGIERAPDRSGGEPG